MMKIVLRAELNCEKCRREAYEAISRVEGVESATVDIKEKKVTVIGDADPACLTMQLRRLGWAEIVSVGPNQEAPKPMIKNPPKDDKKEAPVKNGSKKEAEVKNDSKKEPEGKKEPKNPPPPKQASSMAQPMNQPLDVNVYVRGFPFPEEKPSYNQTLVIRGDNCHHCCDQDVYFLSDENPNACSIC